VSNGGGGGAGAPRPRWRWRSAGLGLGPAGEAGGTAPGAQPLVLVPPARADHTACLWCYCDDGVWKDLLVVFGGSQGGGVGADVWLYDARRDAWTEVSRRFG
jgi:hypothetical protein